MHSIRHILYNKELNSEFKCENAILKSRQYSPEILILGTFNPSLPNSNYADFFYGRNYLWPAFKNIFTHKETRLLGTRMPKRGKPKKPLDPNVNEIFDLCKKLKLTFADLILEVLHNNADYHILRNDNICFDNQTFNLIQDDKKEQISGLTQLKALNQINWNTSNIIDYLCNHQTIQTIYLTRQPKGIWLHEWQEIKKHKCCQGRTFVNIFTPSGQGKPVLNSMERLIRHWIFNMDNNFGKLDENWLNKHSVDIMKFK
ncbi:MAG: hypothetical protein V4620_05430 [Bacteroidota bacterium]